MTTEAGRALLRSDFDTTGWGPNVVRRHVTEAIAAIEREAWLQGHDEAVRLQAETDADFVAAERERIRAEVKALPTLVLPTGTYVDVESVFEAIEP